MKDNKKKYKHIARCEARYNVADINDKLIINLRDISHTMRYLYEGKGSQKRILIVLDEIGSNITQRELTQRLGIQPGSASEVIAKLESEGYIKRTTSETDRRTTDVALTAEGKSAAVQAKEERVSRHEQMFSCLSEDEKISCCPCLKKFVKIGKNVIRMVGRPDTVIEGMDIPRIDKGENERCGSILRSISSMRFLPVFLWLVRYQWIWCNREL